MEMKLRGFIHKIVSAASLEIGKSAPSPAMRSSKVVVPLHNRSHPRHCGLSRRNAPSNVHVRSLPQELRLDCETELLTPKPAAKSRSVNNG